ncbi:MAG: lytic transglycosylase domain-containing protein [Candidatus Dormibacteraeota bacterium]|nr:lytic transglycosylase domain-containing protein [Candidatus Dormibacteraeota bacterium]
MPPARRLLLALVIAGAGLTGLTQYAATGPIRAVSASQLAQVRLTLEQQARARLPEFGHRNESHRALGAVQQTGGQLDHSGSRLNSKPAVVKILKAAAIRHQLDPRLVVALSYWESGWDQSKVSVTGAVGLMQVEPPTAAEAGPKLLGRAVNVQDPFDNADIGAAVLKENLNSFGSPEMALAAYYQGPNSLKANGMLGDTQAYVTGILALAARLDV